MHHQYPLLLYLLVHTIHRQHHGRKNKSVLVYPTAPKQERRQQEYEKDKQYFLCRRISSYQPVQCYRTKEIQEVEEDNIDIITFTGKHIYYCNQLDNGITF